MLDDGSIGRSFQLERNRDRDDCFIVTGQWDEDVHEEFNQLEDNLHRREIIDHLIENENFDYYFVACSDLNFPAKPDDNEALTVEEIDG